MVQYSKKLEKAAQEGDVEAQYNLALCYQIGSGIVSNWRRTNEWFTKAASNGHLISKHILVLRDDYYYGEELSDYKTVIKYFFDGVKNNDPTCQYYLGLCYGRGYGVKKDINKAKELFLLAANQQYISAQVTLGFLYTKGEGVPQDYQKAVELFQFTADKGNAVAQYNLGLLHAKGEGVPQDYQKAVEWFQKSADHGHTSAIHHLGNCYKVGKGVPQDDQKAAKYFLEAANQGFLLSYNNLGLLYQEGEGVPQDHQKALELFQFAADKGNSLAQRNLGLLYQDGKVVPQDYKKAAKYFLQSGEIGREFLQNRNLSPYLESAMDELIKEKNTQKIIKLCVKGESDLLEQFIKEEYKEKFVGIEGFVEKTVLVDIFNSDKNGKTPLMHSLIIGNKKISIILLKRELEIVGQDINGTRNVGMHDTNLDLINFHLSVVNEDLNFIRGLISDRKKIIALKDTRRNKSGMAAIHLAINNPEILSLLLENGAEVNLTTLNGYTSIYLAIEQENLELCKILLEHGADLNIKNSYGISALEYAHKNSSRDFNIALEKLIKDVAKEKSYQAMLEVKKTMANIQRDEVSDRRELKEQLQELFVKDVIGDAKKEIWHHLNSNVGVQTTVSSKALIKLANILEDCRDPQSLRKSPKEYDFIENIVTTPVPTHKGHTSFKRIVEKIKSLEAVTKLISDDKLLPKASKTFVNERLAIISAHYDSYMTQVIDPLNTTESRELLYNPQSYLDSSHPEINRRYLTKETADKLFSSGKDEMHGTHGIKKLTDSQNRSIHFKKDPHAPGVEFMVGSLNKLFSGKGAAITELLKFTQITKSESLPHIFLASKTVFGTELQHVIEQHPEDVRKVNPKNFSSMILLSLLTDPQDGKADNYMVEVELEADKKTVKSLEIIGIDNDISFADPIIMHHLGSRKGQHYVNVKNVLYFFPQMQDLVSPEFKEEFNRNIPEIIMINWLSELESQNQKYNLLLEQNIMTEDEFKDLKLPIALVPGTSIKLFSKLNKAKELLSDPNNQSLTHNQLFKALEPTLYRYYQYVFRQNDGDILESLYDLYKLQAPSVEELVKLQQDIKRGETSTLTKIVLDHYKAKLYDFEDRRLQDIKEAAEEFISKIDFSKFNSEAEILIQREISDKLGFIEKLTISNSKTLDRTTLPDLLKKFKNLKSLTIYGSGNLAALDIRNALEEHPNLEISIGDDCQKLDVNSLMELSNNPRIRDRLNIIIKDQELSYQETIDKNQIAAAPIIIRIGNKTGSEILKEILSSQDNTDNKIKDIYSEKFFEFCLAKGVVDPGLLLRLSVEKGLLSAVNFFISKGVDLGIRNNTDQSNLIHVAVENKDNEEVLRLLLDKAQERKIDLINQKDKKEMTPLDRALDLSNGNVVEALLSKGAKLEESKIIRTLPGAELFKLLIEKDIYSEEIFDYVKNHKRDFNLADHRFSSGTSVDTMSFLHICSGYVTENAPKIAKYLLDNGVDISAQDRKKVPALHIAARNGNVGVLKVLLEHYQKHYKDSITEHLNIKDENNRTALDKAVATEAKNNKDHQTREFISLLLENGAISDNEEVMDKAQEIVESYKKYQEREDIFRGDKEIEPYEAEEIKEVSIINLDQSKETSPKKRPETKVKKSVEVKFAEPVASGSGLSEAERQAI